MNKEKIMKKILKKITEFLCSVSLLSIAEIAHIDQMWWVGILMIEWDCEDAGSFLYFEWDTLSQDWKFDFLWIRPLYYKWLEKD